MLFLLLNYLPTDSAIEPHYKDIEGVGFKTLHENDPVTYLLEKGPKGFKAQEVNLATFTNSKNVVLGCLQLFKRMAFLPMRFGF